jgi:putative hydrolase of the HAD superfamily
LRWLHSHTGVAVCFEDFLETAVSEIMHFHQLVDENQIDPLLMHEFRLKNTFARYEIAWDDSITNLYQERLINACLPFAGVESLLQTIQPKVKLGLVTNAYDGVEQRARIKNSGLWEFFDCIVIAGEIDNYKPDPAIFLHAVNQIKAASGRTLFVGDSVRHDIVGAKSVGLTTVLFSKKQSDQADYIVDSIDALSRVLIQLTGQNNAN